MKAICKVMGDFLGKMIGLKGQTEVCKCKNISLEPKAIRNSLF